MTYLDTSVLVAYYCPEPLSAAAQHAIQAQRDFMISSLVEVEMMSALARKVRARAMRLQDARRVQDVFQDHLLRNVYTRLTLSSSHFLKARQWLATFSVEVQTLDALHMAVAAAEGALLLTADRALANACGVLGIRNRLVS